MVAICCVRVLDAIIVLEDSVERRCCKCNNLVWVTRASIAKAERESKGEVFQFVCIQCVNIDDTDNMMPISDEQKETISRALKNKPN